MVDQSRPHWFLEAYEDTVEDAVYRAMADPYRRLALYVLLEQERCTLDELTDAVTGWAHSRASAGADRAAWNRVRTGLAHADLPTLEEADLVEYDRTTREISLTIESAPVQSLVRWALGREMAQDRSFDSR